MLEVDPGEVTRLSGGDAAERSVLTGQAGQTESAYVPEFDEVFYCGQCRRQQRPEEGIPCKICGKRTVSWRDQRETWEDAHRRWKHING